MEREFWLDRWRNGEIGFHQADVDSTLRRFWPALGIESGAAVFVPLCGKTRDMGFLEECGHPVIGVELSETAVRAYFEDRGEQPTREQHGGLVRFQGKGSTIYCGDYFDLGPGELAEVRGVYDRAALIALPPELRRRYVEHALSVLPRATNLQILLMTLEYDQEAVPGPPFSVGDAEVRASYASCAIELLDQQTARGLPPKFAAIADPIARAYRVALP